MAPVAHLVSVSHFAASFDFRIRCILDIAIFTMEFKRQLFPEEILDGIHLSEEENLNDSNYPDSDDFESEFDDDLMEDDVFTLTSENVSSYKPANKMPARAYANMSSGNIEPAWEFKTVDWTADTTGFTDRLFSPTNIPGPKNLPTSINADSTPIEYLDVLWDAKIWESLVKKTNQHAHYVLRKNRDLKAANSIAKKNITLDEMKSFLLCGPPWKCFCIKTGTNNTGKQRMLG
uniref:uncharacterized protein LOC120335781 n=1 Tax=Styela clava TaxID=7725 RepID=UPI00193A9AB7|nr:uncharacterized protein LOC120335781 [Styela clava]